MAEPHVVREFLIGNTKIRIADDYCVKTAEEVEQILSRIAEQAQRHIAAATAGTYGPNENISAIGG